MKKILLTVFWCVMYIIFLDLFAYDLIIQGRWNVFSWTTVYSTIAAVSLINLGYWVDRK